MLMGLQGSGKTTTAAKLARLSPSRGSIRCSRGGHPAARRDGAAPDARRPARRPGDRPRRADPLEICRAAREEAAARGLTPLILDTAGRLHIDEALLEELRAIRRRSRPTTCSSWSTPLTGQDAGHGRATLNQAVGIDAVILTKLDGDSAAAPRSPSGTSPGAPSRVVGVGEKTDALEPFHPDAWPPASSAWATCCPSSRGAKRRWDQTQAEALARSSREDTFSLADFRDQLKQLRQMGRSTRSSACFPREDAQGRAQGSRRRVGRPRSVRRDHQLDDAGERDNPEIINGSRRQRIARAAARTCRM